MNEILGYVSGNAIVAERNLQKFDGCKVRIEIMDKKNVGIGKLVRSLERPWRRDFSRRDSASFAQGQGLCRRNRGMYLKKKCANL